MDKKSSRIRVRVFFLTLIMIIMIVPLTAFAIDGEGDEGEAPSVEVPTTPENGIPLIVINIDECDLHPETDDKGETNYYGSIQDMNDSPDHSVRCRGSVDILVPDGYEYGYGASVFNPEGDGTNLTLSYIRGRGNSTWQLPKRPYKIKFKEKQNLFGMGKCKEWGLLANAVDITLMKNRIMSWLAERMDMPFTPQLVPVDVVMRGSNGSETYLGSYCLSELVDVDKNRVNIAELDENITAEEGEENITGGYLISVYNDLQNYTDPRNSVFTTDAGEAFIIESPEYTGDEISDLTEGQKAQREYIGNYMQELEDLIMKTETIDKATHNKIASMMDLKSTADYWLLQMLTQNGDGYTTDSTYLYKDRNGKLYWGPAWDFDLALGYQNDTSDLDEYDDDVTGFNFPWFSWIAALREKDPRFVSLLINEWDVMDEKLAELTEDSESGPCVIDRFREEIAASQVKNGILWPYFSEDDTAMFNLAVQKQKKWLNMRRDWINDNIGSIQKATVTLRYYADGNLLKTEKVKENTDSFNPPDPPEKEGKVFYAWYCEKEEEYLGKFDINKDSDFVAKYIDADDVIDAAAVYLARKEDWVDLQDEQYNANSEFRIVPDDVTFRDVVWSSENEDIATVTGDGVVILKGAGNVIITATHNSGISASYTLHIYDSKTTQKQELTGVRTDKGNISMVTGELTQLTWTIEPGGDALRGTVLSYKSSDESVAMVDEFGVVTATGPGTAKITLYVTPIISDDEITGNDTGVPDNIDGEIGNIDNIDGESGDSGDPGFIPDGEYEDPNAFKVVYTITVKEPDKTDPNSDSGKTTPGKTTPGKTVPADAASKTRTQKRVNPRGTYIKRLKRSSKSITVKWKKQTKKVSKSHITGYQIQIATNRKFTKNIRYVTVKGYRKTSGKISRLNRGTRYYLRIRTYKTIKGQRYYSAWSGRISTRTKK